MFNKLEIQPPCVEYYDGRLWQGREFDAWSEADRQFIFRGDHKSYNQPIRRGQNSSPTWKESHLQPESKVVSNHQENHRRNRR